MDYRMENIDFEVRFVGKRFPVKTARAFKRIPEIHRETNKDGFRQKLIDMSWENPKCSLASIAGICCNGTVDDEKFDYFLAVRYDSEAPADMEELIIPPCTYAVFPNVVNAWKRLYSEWLPTSGYELANQPCIEHYLGPGHKVKHELWVPIADK